MSFSISDTRLAAIMLSQEMNRLLRLPPSKSSRQKPVTSQLEPIDWDLCQDLDEWSKEAEMNENELSKHNSSAPKKRARSVTPENDDANEEDAIFQPQKKLKTESKESEGMALVADHTSATSSFLSTASFLSAHPILSSIETTTAYPMAGGFETAFTAPFESLEELTTRKATTKRRDAERQNFIIWEDEDAGYDNSNAYGDYCGFTMAPWVPTHPDEDKENHPPEYDLAMEDEPALSDSEDYYYSEEQVQQGYRGVLSEIQN